MTYIFKEDTFVTAVHQRWAEKLPIAGMFASVYKCEKECVCWLNGIQMAEWILMKLSRHDP